MKTNNRSFENFDELVFENKNKTYGAYSIRKSYSDHVTISLLITLAVFGVFTFLGVWLTNSKIELPAFSFDNITPILPGVEVNIKPPIIPEKKIEQKVESAPKTVSGQMAASDNKNNIIEKTNLENQISNNPNPKGTDSIAKNNDPVLPPPTEINKPAKIEIVVDKMPEFENMSQFIAANLHYPPYAVEKGTTGIVYVTFVVELDGTVSNIQILKGIGDGCEQEAARVVKIMKNWKPGINHNQQVRVQCNLPIKFSLQ